ncbi:hypothetical protein Poly21_15720 [Allorhodopirellula heiligendammensis]|uniref:Uncharacterized protein n=1 Tax=Allorhodopirellula heiligendammensis TaxID=2714739 RepID=A0A5C6C9F5_9BACT|nr:hypothetical protein Poly21_15720 [Allorhodopirellula heiligendammensis]
MEKSDGGLTANRREKAVGKSMADEGQSRNRHPRMTTFGNESNRGRCPECTRPKRAYALHQ